jgi:hypothetical protein
MEELTSEIACMNFKKHNYKTLGVAQPNWKMLTRITWLSNPFVVATNRPRTI